MAIVVNSVDPSVSLGQALGTGLGSGLTQGLNQLMQARLQEAKTNRLTSLLQQAGYPQQTANLVSNLGAQSPELVARILEQLGAQSSPQMSEDIGVSEGTREGQPTFAQAFGKGKQSEAERRKIDEEASDLSSLYHTIKTLRKGLSDENITFGKVSALASQLPETIAQDLVGADTLAWGSAANKLVTDLAKKIPGVKSKYLTQRIESSKPSLTRSRQQNARILDLYEPEIDELAARFIKRHPSYASAFSLTPKNKEAFNRLQSGNQQPEQEVKQETFEFIDGKTGKKLQGRYIDETTVEYTDPSSGQLVTKKIAQRK